jgi:hypothetical protein
MSSVGDIEVELVVSKVYCVSPNTVFTNQSEESIFNQIKR